MASLSKERWTVLGPLLDEALDLPADDRARFLARLHRETPDLAADLEALLAQETSPLQALLDAQSAPELRGHGLAGQSVGKYTLDRLIGQGGMATVWLARRTDGRFEAEVAVKLLNLALLGRAGAERFAQEGTVLARLTHPNIARLLDAGVTPAGQPFLVLEHVVGERIDQFADQRRLTPAQRIDLCLAVLAALASAHANLIIHRDIKPSNILVTPDGHVKLLDFGIAKLLLEGRPSADPATLTEHGGRALTPEYAAPELVLGEPVSTATDVYSAGVLLYVLLSGTHPTGAGARTPAEHIRSIVEVEPPRLSDVVSSAKGALREELGQRAAVRGANPERLRRLYTGDLDNILAKALKKQAADRYPTVTALAEDLARFRRHEPVRARPDSWGYRSRKFLRRHRSGLAVAALIVLTLLGSTAFSVKQMLLAREERDRAADALRRSRATTTFESLLFRLLDPGGEALTYRQLLDKGREVLERRYRGDPVSRMQLGIQFAQNYLRGHDEAAAYAIVRGMVATADSLGDALWRGRTRCELALVQAERGLADSALALVSEARALLAGVRHVERGTLNACDGGVAEALMALRRPDSAAHHFRVVADRFAAAEDSGSEDHLIALNDHVRALYAARRYRAALSGASEILAASRAGVLTDPHDLPVFIHNGATLFEVLGEFRGLRAHLEREMALAARPDSTAPHPMLAFDYGWTLTVLGHTDSAEAWFQAALDRMGGGDSARAYIVHLTLAGAARAAGRGADAAGHRRRAAQVEAGAQASLLARAVRAADRIEAAADRRDPVRALAIVRAELESAGYTADASSRAFFVPLVASSTALIAAGAHAEAAEYAAHLVRIGSVDSLAASRSGIVGHGLLLGAEAERGRHQVAEARELARRAVAPLTFGLGAAHPLTLRATALRDSLGT